MTALSLGLKDLSRLLALGTRFSQGLPLLLGGLLPEPA